MADDNLNSMVEQLTSEHEGICASLKERLEALLKTIYLLSRIIPIDENSTSSADIEKNKSEGEEGGGLSLIYKELDELSSDWNLEETAVPVLISSIHKVQSNMNVVSKEADLAETENKYLKKSLGKSEELNVVLKKYCKAMYRENLELKQALSKKAKEKECLIKGLKELSFKAREEAEVSEVETFKLKTALHEQNLQKLCEKSSICDDDMSCISTLTSHSTIFDDGMATVFLYPEQESPRTTKRLILKISIRSNKLGLQFLMMPDKYAGDELYNDVSIDDEVGLFVVCGFHGFDDTVNNRPDLGAKLIAIGNLSLERTKYTTNDLHHQINSRLSSTSAFNLSFRNDELTKIQRDSLNKAIIATNDSCVTTGIFNISFRKSEKGAMTSHVQELSPLIIHEETHQQVFDSEDRESPMMDEAADDLNSCIEQEIIVKDLDSMYSNNEESVLDSPRSLCTESTSYDSPTVLRGWSTSTSNPSVQETPVLREWGSSKLDNKSQLHEKSKDHSCDGDKVKQTVKTNKTKRRLWMF